MFRRFMIMTALLLAVFTKVVLVAAVPLHADSSAFQYGTTNLAIPAPSVSTLLAPVTTPTIPGSPGRNDPKPQDIVTVQPSTSTVTVQPSNGNGTFGAPISTVIAGGAQAVAVGDFNNDGALDIAVTQQLAGHQDGDVVVLTGDGHGHFSNPVMYAAGRHAGFFSQYSTVQVGDLNHDGHPDIILGESATECCSRVGIEVLLNDGQGNFSAPIQYQLGSTYVGVLQLTLADMNNDGILDVVTTNSDSFGGYAIVVQLGIGNGTFQPPIITNAPWPRQFVLADLNHDGFLDMVTSTDYYNDNIPRQLAVYMGKGDGNFQAPGLYDVPLNSPQNTDGFRVAIVDGNNDGIPDIAVASPSDTRMMFFQNLGKGGLIPIIPAPTVRVHTPVTALLSGDLNGGSPTDLVSVNAGGDPGDGTIIPADMTLFFGANSNPTIAALPAKFGSPLNGIISTLTGVSQQTGLTATIDWGDGTQTTGVIGTPTTGTVIVMGSHTYWIPKGATILVTLRDALGAVVQTQKVPVEISSQYVALGDSFSSGEGATGTWPPGDNNIHYTNPFGNPQKTDDPNNNWCHRSTQSYAMNLWNYTLNPADSHISMVNAACSGAIISDFYTTYDKNLHGGFYPHVCNSPAQCKEQDIALPDHHHNGEVRQLDRVTKDTSLVTLTISGNDLGFAKILKTCVTGSETECLSLDNAATTAAHSIINKNALVNVYREIKKRAPGARIMVLGYPRFFPNKPNVDCSGLGNDAHLNSNEIKWLNGSIAAGNQMIQAAVHESGVAEFVDVHDAFKDHEICSSGNTNDWFMNGLILQPVRDFPPLKDSQESFHPNPAGHSAETVILAKQFTAGEPASYFQTSQVIAPSATADIPIDLSGIQGNDSFIVSSSWPTDAQPKISLYDQNNTLVTGQNYPQSSSNYGSTYAYTYIYGSKWHAATWRLHIDNTGESLSAPLTVRLEPKMLRLPPLAKFKIVANVTKCYYPGAGDIYMSYTLDGSMSIADNSLRYPRMNKITNWKWSTGQSGKDPKTGGFARLPLTVFLTVTDSQGQHGYYSQYLTCQ